MRRLHVTCLLASLAAVSCAPGGSLDPLDMPTDQSESAISWGDPDNGKHTAVVALLIPATGGMFAECSGTIVKQANGFAYVLTAAHCCVDGSPEIATTNQSYLTAENALFGGPLSSGVYQVDTSSAYYHSSFDMQNLGAGHDFCMLKFPASGTLATIKLPASTSDGVYSGVALEHVGYGTTNYVPDNTARNTGTGPVTQADSQMIIYHQGGDTKATATPGTCQGDSGGPALIPAGAAQSQQTVVGVTSFGGADQNGNAIQCGKSDTGGAVRVSAEIGTGKFITRFLADNPTGTPAGTASTSSSSSGGQSCGFTTGDTTCDGCLDGSCCSQSTNCANDSACVTCVTSANPPASCSSNANYNAFVSCFSNQCSSACGGGSQSCGFTTGDATCDTCLEGSCCAQSQACFDDATCKSCATSTNPPASCNSNTKLNAFYGCLANKCANPCGISTSSSSSSGGTTSSSSSSGGTSSGGTSSGGTSTSSSGGQSTSGGVGGGGVGGGGAGNNGTGGSANPNQEGGCSVGTTGSSPTNDAALGGLLLGAALFFSRRRRSA